MNIYLTQLLFKSIKSSLQTLLERGTVSRSIYRKHLLAAWQFHSICFHQKSIYFNARFSLI